MVDPVAVTNGFWDLKATEVLKFISGIISSVAWPLAAFFILRLFREELLKLIPFLSKFSVMGVSAEFNRKLDAAEAEVAKTAAPVSTGTTASPPTVPSVSGEQAEPAPTATIDPRTRDPRSVFFIPSPGATDPVALRANPTGVVMESWKALESTLVSLAVRSRRFRPSDMRSLNLGIIRQLRDDNVVSDSEAEALRELMQLRNLAAHSHDRSISEAEATRFSNIAATLAASLRDKGPQPPEEGEPA